VSLQDLIPGLETHGGAELTAYVVAAKLDQSLTGCEKKKAEQKAFVAQNQGIKLMRYGHDDVKISGG
jgi:hypothetical protein